MDLQLSNSGLVLSPRPVVRLLRQRALHREVLVVVELGVDAPVTNMANRYDYESASQTSNNSCNKRHALNFTRSKANSGTHSVASLATVAAAAALSLPPSLSTDCTLFREW